MIGAVIALAGALAALIWRALVDDRRSADLLATTRELEQTKGRLEQSEAARSVAEDGVAELADQLERQQAHAKAVEAELEAKLARARDHLAAMTPRDKLPDLLNHILTPSPGAQ